MWVVEGTCVTHVVCRPQMHIINSSFAYCSDWLKTKKGQYQEFYMGHSDGSWYVRSGVLHIVLLSMHVGSSFAFCSEWSKAKKKKNAEFCIRRSGVKGHLGGHWPGNSE